MIGGCGSSREVRKTVLPRTETCSGAREFVFWGSQVVIRRGRQHGLLVGTDAEQDAR